jgi:hypothetical protein
MEFIKTLLCAPGKEAYNGKCVKACEPGKSRNLKTGRCNKIKTSKKAVKSNNPTKTNKSTKTNKPNKTLKFKSIPSIKRDSTEEEEDIRLCPVGKEVFRGPFGKKCYKVCNKGKTRNPLTARCRNKATPTMFLKSPENKDIFKVVYENYNVDPEAKRYLNKLVGNASASKLRKLAREHDLLPLDEHPDDMEMKEYIVDNILDRAQYAAWDSDKSETIQLKHVYISLDNDPDMLALFRGKFPAKY